MNDRAGITIKKNFYSFVIEAGHYDKLTFERRTVEIILIKLDD